MGLPVPHHFPPLRGEQVVEPARALPLGAVVGKALWDWECFAYGGACRKVLHCPPPQCGGQSIQILHRPPPELGRVYGRGARSQRQQHQAPQHRVLTPEVASCRCR
jgi:hypothetical protein